MHTIAETSEFVRDVEAARMPRASRLALKYRVLTAYVGPDAPVYLLAVLSKGDRDTFSGAEVQQLATLTSSIRTYRHRRQRRSA